MSLFTASKCAEIGRPYPREKNESNLLQRTHLWHLPYPGEPRSPLRQQTLGFCPSLSASILQHVFDLTQLFMHAQPPQKPQCVPRRDPCVRSTAFPDKAPGRHQQVCLDVFQCMAFGQYSLAEVKECQIDQAASDGRANYRFHGPPVRIVSIIVSRRDGHDAAKEGRGAR